MPFHDFARIRSGADGCGRILAGRSLSQRAEGADAGGRLAGWIQAAMPAIRVATAFFGIDRRGIEGPNR
jgi:hypothetical protein